MSPIVVEGSGSGGATEALEQLVLDGLNLAYGDNWTLENNIQAAPPKKRMEWAQAADLDGAWLVRDPLFENREITLRLRVNQQANMDVALQILSELVGKLEECEREPDGLPLEWTPTEASETITFYVLSGEIEEMPVSWNGDDVGWFIRSPVVTVKLICKPFGYGEEVTVGSTSSSAPLATLTIANVKGDVPAEGRLLVTDASSQNRRFVEWGLEQRQYDSSTSLLLDASGLATGSGFSGTLGSGSGTYGGNEIFSYLYRQQRAAVCGTGNQGHTGTFRVKARVNATLYTQVRIVYQSGDGPLAANPYATSQFESTWEELDLGLITITPSELGTHRWTGRIEAFNPSLSGGIHLDYLILIPAGEGYGKARAAYRYQPGVVGGFDDFTSTTAGNALGTRTAVLGGNWATSGSTTDFAFSDFGGYENSEALTRNTGDSGDGRFAILGSTNYTNVEGNTFVSFGFRESTGAEAEGGVVVRWTDANNHLRAWLNPQSDLFVVEQMLSGSQTTLASTPITVTSDVLYAVKLVAFATGRVLGQVWLGGAVVAEIETRSTTLATGGTLATGKFGIRDYGVTGTPPTRFYDYPNVSTPQAEPIALYSGRQLEFRHDGAIRQDSTGTYWGQTPAYRGSRFLIPPAGDTNRTSRIAVKAHRNDIEAAPDDTLGDSIQVSGFYTPRYLTPPGV